MEHNRISNKFEQIRESMCCFLFCFLCSKYFLSNLHHTRTTYIKMAFITEVNIIKRRTVGIDGEM